MACAGNDYVFWLLYIVQISNCITIHTIRDNDVSNLSETVTSETEGTDKTNRLIITAPAYTDEKMMTSEPKGFRVKRQSGGGKYTESAQMPQVKVLRLFLQMLKNLWAPEYVGGVHPFHHEVPKPVVKLWKDKIVAFFFPPIGQEAVKE